MLRSAFLCEREHWQDTLRPGNAVLEYRVPPRLLGPDTFPIFCPSSRQVTHALFQLARAMAIGANEVESLQLSRQCLRYLPAVWRDFKIIG